MRNAHRGYGINRVAVEVGNGPAAIDALIQLSRDAKEEIRDWATCGLGSMIPTDSPQIRDALFARLGEESNEIRGEAAVGLAARGDERVYETLACALTKESIGILYLDAAELLKDKRLLPLLQEIEKDWADDEEDCFIKRLRDAIKACSHGEGASP